MKSIDQCVEYTLGSAAISFIKDSRLARGHTLARRLLRNLQLDSGKATVFLPPGFSTDELERDFEGGVLPLPPESKWQAFVQDDGMKVVVTPIDEIDSDLVAIVLRHVRASEDNLCILEDPLKLLVPDVPNGTRGLSFRDEAYYLLQGTALHERDVGNALAVAKSSWGMVAALTSLPPPSAISQTQRHLTAEQLQLMAERAVSIFTVAYDGEGYLIWQGAAT